MSSEATLLALARVREAAPEAALSQLELEPPDRVLRELRAYMVRQVDLKRIKPITDRVVHLTAKSERGRAFQELTCPAVEFYSESRLEFNVQMEQQRLRWFVRCFHFHLRLPSERGVKMVRIHLKPQSWHDPLRVPRCHLHIGDSHAHVPFPIMPPLLMLDLICTDLEADFGI